MSPYSAPTRGKPFIAFEGKTRPAPGQDGQTVHVRPSVYVREHVDIKVAAYKDKTSRKGSDGEFTLGRVTFDAGSVGLEHDFSASVEAGSKAAQLLADAFKNDTPVTVAIETSRRYAAKDGDPISSLTPINELRGIVGDVTVAQAEITGRNCRVLVVGVNGQFTSELLTNPEEWDMLRDNRDGQLAPPGWAVYHGGIISASSAFAEGDVTTKVLTLLESYFEGKGTPTVGPQSRPAMRGPRAVESKPWDNWNTDGRFNHGSYLATAIRETHATAHRMAAEAGVDPVGNQPSVRALTELLLAMADRIQLGVYRATDGIAVRSDRSHHEARQWIDFVVTHCPDLTYTPQMADPLNPAAVEARNSWSRRVVTTAGRLMDNVAQTAESDNQAWSPTGSPVIRPADREADLTARYEALLAHDDVKLTTWPDRVDPLLAARFGTSDLTCVEAAHFAVALTEWETDPAAFLTAARDSALAQQTNNVPAAEAA
ncbi:hypothetical protein [Streptomyces sp. NPDC051572]|uniref:hypothetical protein n=1 Tax=Streptomyces sp. NPDC051572 TaxID=3155802 RepID=UPI00344DBBCB